MLQKIKQSECVKMKGTCYNEYLSFVILIHYVVMQFRDILYDVHNSINKDKLLFAKTLV